MASRKHQKMQRDGDLYKTRRNEFDISNINVLHKGVDTLRYLYNGFVNLETYQLISDLYESTHGAIFGFADITWKLGSGGASGYRYRLQNNDIGLIIFYGSKHNKIDLDKPDNNTQANHFKIEISPHYLLARSAEQVDKEIDSIVKHFLDEYGRPKLAAHLCVDIQGWQMPDDFCERFVSRAPRIFNYKSVSEYEFDLAATSVVYGNNDTITYGKANSLQFQIYNKSKAIKAQDKVDLWERQWKKVTDDNFKPLYDQNQPVYRIEYRYHHTVIEQFSRTVSLGQDSEGNECIWGNEKIRSYAKLEEHLNGIWQYAVMKMRLDHSTDYIDPLWCMLLDDIQFHPNVPDFMYKREYKKTGSGGTRNAIMALANTLSILVRTGKSRKEIFKAVKQDSYWPDIYAYYISRGFNTHAIRDHVYNAVDNRILSGKAV